MVKNINNELLKYKRRVTLINVRFSKRGTVQDVLKIPEIN